MTVSMKFFGNEADKKRFPGWSNRAVFFAMLLLASTHSTADGSAQSNIQVSAKVLTVIKMKVVRQPGQLNIEQRHINRLVGGIYG